MNNYIISEEVLLVSMYACHFSLLMYGFKGKLCLHSLTYSVFRVQKFKLLWRWQKKQVESGVLVTIQKTASVANRSSVEPLEHKIKKISSWFWRYDRRLRVKYLERILQCSGNTEVSWYRFILWQKKYITLCKCWLHNHLLFFTCSALF